MSRTYVMGEWRTYASGFSKCDTPISVRKALATSELCSSVSRLLTDRSLHAARKRLVCPMIHDVM